MTPVLPAAPRPRRRWLQGHSERWLQWQSSTVSQRLLSDKDREKGYTALWIPPPLRETFLDVAQALRLYDTLVHKPRRTLSPDQLTHLADWARATQALIAALKENHHD